MIYLGIDPGASGAAVILASGASPVAVTLPELPALLRRLWTEHPCQDVKACLEEVSAMPGQGVSSMFTFGASFGYCKGVLEATRVPYQLVRPQRWQKDLAVSKPAKPAKSGDATADRQASAAHKRAGKTALWEHAKRLFPGVEIKKDHADAFLLAEWCRRFMGGQQ